jgi:hypothetical protein
MTRKFNLETFLFLPLSVSKTRHLILYFSPFHRSLVFFPSMGIFPSFSRRIKVTSEGAATFITTTFGTKTLVLIAFIC